ncbi:HAD family hydrolase [Streptomonospora wellingtoniae]|uniref:HAD family phosphatase n=1 Tax=Streptomonospora wellingtoniae TaxID=3075544 RepID=A0ABU2KX72_9ACTN|nr:HAD family phosphatase [Streptomonospora sp. DSM 45055]MDT0303894.1 HAD family phosphatase [Streptomonospora sp. DSM 45055]
MTAIGAPLQAVLFDMDGTLIDSEHLWGRAESATAASLGGEWTAQDHRRSIGGAAVPVARYMIERAGARAGAHDVADRLQAEFARLLAGGAEPRPGAKELVARVAASGVPSALVTSTERALVDSAIGAIGVDSFDVSVAGDEVAANKPDPAPYLTAARMLGAEPARCVAFEDSEVGVASALAAGCATVAVVDQVAFTPGGRLHVLESLAGVDLDWVGSLVAA